MNLRSSNSGISIKDDNLQYTESSEEDDSYEVSSDCSYHALSDEGEVSLSDIEEEERIKILDLNNEPEIGVALKKKGESSSQKKNKLKEKDLVVCGIDEPKKVPEPEIDFYEVTEMNKIPKKKKRKRKGKNKPTLMWEVWEEELDRWVEQNLNIDVDVNNQNEVAVETVEPPSDLIMPLLRYQKEWLAWALKQEESPVRGGILADEMGMGKTVQAIALVLAKRELRSAICGPDGGLTGPSSSTALPEIKGTLVICPLVAVIQWVNEIDRFTTKGSNKVLVYHGANRGKYLHQFSEYDFIITTYSIVESEYRKNVMPPKHKCNFCSKLFHEKRLAIHLRYFCGPNATRTDKQSKQQRKKKSKLKVCDESEEFVDSGDDKSKGTLKKSGNRKKKSGVGSSNDNLEGDEHDLSPKKSNLHSVKWDRIILDEAHYIKDRRCNTTRAILALESSYKWALSGTPLQNRVGELYSLVRFLQISPYSYYFCKDCDCRELDYNATDCPSCPHKSVRHFCWWNKFIATPIQSYGNSGNGKNAMIVLKHKILKGVVLRRTKKGRAADLALPPRIVSLRKDTLDIKEEDYYTSLYNESQAQFNTYIEEGTLMNNYAHIFDLLTRLRQAVDHPYLVVYSSSSMAKSGRLLDDATNDEQVCGLCHDPVEDPVVTSCTHVFCKSCLIEYSASMGEVSCPSCSILLTVDFTTNNYQNNTTTNNNSNTKMSVKGFKRSSILNRIRLDEFQTSTKIDALREEIRFMVERDGSAKGIVFSQFTSFLDLIHYSLQKSGVNCVQLDGSMTMNARDAAIKRFTQDPDCRIFLMSLKAGGVALNLTVASHVFLMDPWWNPAVERQAQDRIHRIGQYKPIRIVRFVIEDTIEERILKLQEKKELVFEGTVGGSSEALGKLTEADMRFLFVT